MKYFFGFYLMSGMFPIECYESDGAAIQCEIIGEFFEGGTPMYVDSIKAAVEEIRKLMEAGGNAVYGYELDDFAIWEDGNNAQPVVIDVSDYFSAEWKEKYNR